MASSTKRQIILANGPLSIAKRNAPAGNQERVRGIAPVVYVHNMCNLTHRDGDALIDALLADGIAYVPYFRLGGFSSLLSA